MRNSVEEVLAPLNDEIKRLQGTISQLEQKDLTSTDYREGSEKKIQFLEHRLEGLTTKNKNYLKEIKKYERYRKSAPYKWFLRLEKIKAVYTKIKSKIYNTLHDDKVVNQISKQV